MLQFFKYVLATIVGFFLFCLFSFIIIAVIVSSIAPEKDLSLKDEDVLKIVLDKSISERESDNIFGHMGSPFNSTPPTIGLLELREVLEKAKNDSKIKCVYLDPSGVSAGFATLQELRNALLDFKKSGKFLVAYGETYSEKAYYLASVADQIFLPSTGLLEMNGLESEILFFKGTLDKLELKPEVFKVGAFKSAVEPILFEKMSDSSRAQTVSFLNSIYNTFLQEVSVSRKVNIDLLKSISDSMLVRNAEDAFKFKLITNLEYYDGVENILRKKTGTKEGDKINFISANSYYLKHIDKELKEGDDDKKIAVIFADGDIMSGKGNEKTIGSESLSNEIRKAKLDKTVKAIVLRVNSPGGSALASDIIWREIVLAKKVKPVVASMGDVAASGGYYISMACDSIIAQPTTITGSIGVFGLLLNAENFLKNKLGVTTDRVKTGEFSDLGSFTRPLTNFEREVIQEEVDKIYEDFTTKAANGRSMDVNQLKSLASGRVWSGTEAVNNNLVDGFGGLHDAIKIAAKMSKLGEDYSIQYLPELKNFYFKQLLTQLGGQDEEAYIKNMLGDYYPYINQAKKLQQLEGIQTRMPFEIIIK